MKDIMMKYAHIACGVLALISGFIVLGAVIHDIWVDLPRNTESLYNKVITTSLIGFFLFGSIWLFTTLDS